MKKQPENHQLDCSPPDGKLVPDERETSFLWDDSNKTCLCYTANETLLKKLDGLCKQHPTVFKCTKRQGNCGFYEFPSKYVGLRAPRVLTDEQRADIASRFRNAKKKGVVS